MSDRPSLNELKRQIREKYLGRFGIHGVGARSLEQKIRIYGTGNAAQYKAEFDQLCTDAEPYEVEFIFDEAPNLADMD